MITTSTPDSEMNRAKSAGRGVHCHSAAIDQAAQPRAPTGSASVLISAHSGAGSAGRAAPVRSARRGWPPGRTGCESVRMACAWRAHGVRTGGAVLT